MTVEIIKHQTESNSKGHKAIGCAYFRVKLPAAVREFLGSEVKVRKLPGMYELTNFGQISEGRPSIIPISNWLTMNTVLVEEYEDLGEYLVDIDHENECVNLIKK